MRMGLLWRKNDDGSAGMKLNTYVLNLERHAERLQAVAAQLDAQGIAWQRVAGIDAYAVSAAELDALAAKSGPIPRMPDTARACAAGHLQIIQAFLASDATHALILEDDAVIATDLGQALPDILETFGAGILNISRQNPSGSVKRVVVGHKGQSCAGYAFHALKGIHYTGGGYVVDRTAAELIVAQHAKPNMPIDHILFNPNVSDLFGRVKITQLFPAMVRPRENLASSIQSQQVDGAKTLRNKLKRAKTEISIAPRLLLGLALGRYQAKTLDFKDDLR